MAALGITQWASDRGGGWQNAIRTTAVANAIRLVSESVGSMTMRVYTGDSLQREPVYDHRNAMLFQDPAPSLGLSSFDFWADTAAAIEAYTAAFLWKVRDPAGGILELWPLDPEYFRITGPPQARRVEAWRNGRVTDVTGDVIVIRSWNVKPSADGLATPQLHNETFAWARSYEQYRGRYFDNDGSVHQWIEGGPQTHEARRELARGWAAQYGGVRNAGKVAVLWGQATLKSATPALRDAQAAELAVTIAQNVAQAFRIQPASLLYADSHPVREPNLEFIRGQFFTFTMMHRLRRIQRALAADRDLFPDPRYYPEFDVSQFIRADTLTLGQIAHNMNQTGTLNRDEERALVLGLPAIPGGAGTVYQETPVGGAPGHLGDPAPQPSADD